MQTSTMVHHRRSPAGSLRDWDSRRQRFGKGGLPAWMIGVERTLHELTALLSLHQTRVAQYAIPD